MDIPSKELLIFHNEIEKWVDQVYPDQDKPLVSFKQGTPKSILDLFDTIKSKIGFDYQNTSIKIIIMDKLNMKNKIIEVFKIANHLVSITVENPDFSDLKINHFVRIGEKEYRVRSVPMIHSTPPKSILEIDTFAIDYTEDDLMDKEAVFTHREVSKDD